ncbi:MAG: ATP phosphoribosyltransferase regulatory subunit [bacterium]|nr:ATP phosphoribosyltransferase regulatory subunit [bacterium]
MARPKKILIPRDNFNQFDCFNSKERLINIFRKKLGSLADFYGFSKTHTSPFENHRFFSPLTKAGLLDDREFVIHKNKINDFITLRPSSILSALRAYITNKLFDLSHPLKMSVDEECFRANSKEAAGLVVYPDFSLLMFGEANAVAEAEIFQVVWQSVRDLGFPTDKLEVKINSLGCKECRPSYRSTLSAYLRSRLSRLCKNCKKDLKVSPTNIFSCGEEKCKIVAGNAPAVLDFLCEACKKYLRELLEFLDEMSIPYLLDGKFFRDRSLYNKIIWEIWATGTAQPVEEGGDSNIKDYLIGEGGGLSGVFEILSERPLDVFSGTVFVENLERFVFQEKLLLGGNPKPNIFLIQLGELAKRKSFGLMENLRKAGIEVGESLSKDAIKSQLKSAEVAEVALILGQKEALDRTIIVRDTQSGIQETVPQDKLIDFLKRKLEKQNQL